MELTPGRWADLGVNPSGPGGETTSHALSAPHAVPSRGRDGGVIAGLPPACATRVS